VGNCEEVLLDCPCK